MPGLTISSHQGMMLAPASLTCSHSISFDASLSLKMASVMTSGFDLNNGLCLGDIDLLMEAGVLIV